MSFFVVRMKKNRVTFFSAVSEKKKTFLTHYVNKKKTDTTTKRCLSTFHVHDEYVGLL